MAVRSGYRARARLAVALGLMVVTVAALLLARDDEQGRQPGSASAARLKQRGDAAPQPKGLLPVPQAAMDGPSLTRKASLFVSPDGADTGQCGRSTPCATFGHAYDVASAGEVVEVAEGRYGSQELPGTTKPGGQQVVFRPAPGASVTTGPLTFGGQLATDRGPSGITVRDMTIAGFVTQGSSRLAFVNVTFQGNFAIQGGTDISVIGGRAGGTRDGSHSEIAAWVDGDGRVEPPSRVLVDGVVFHDVRLSKPSDHIECLQATDVRGLVVRNSRFVRCDTFDLRVDRYRTDGPRDVLIENNVFVHTRDRFGGTTYYGLAVRAGHAVQIRSNSSDIGWAGPEPGTPITAWRVSANAMPGGRCDDRIAYSHNLWISGEGCDSSDTTGDPRFVDDSHGDLRLLPGSPALNAASREGAASVDHQLRRRVHPDIGAFEGPVRP